MIAFISKPAIVRPGKLLEEGQGRWKSSFQIGRVH